MRAEELSLGHILRPKCLGHRVLELSKMNARASPMMGSGASRKAYAAPLRPSLSQGVGNCNRRDVSMMGNKAEGGPFAPLVLVTRSIVGKKDFNKFRGKAISLHSQVRSRPLSSSSLQCKRFT